MQDYHIHPGYSIDAAEYPLKDYCERALVLNLKEIAFTTHFEAEPERRHLDWFVRVNGEILPMEVDEWLQFYFAEVEKLKEEYKDRLAIKIGLEVGYFEGIEEIISKLKEKYPFDFLIGSIHTLDHLALSSRKEASHLFVRYSAEDIINNYFNRLENLVKSGLFEVIGHLDLFLRYGLNFFELEKLLVFDEKIRDIFFLIKQKGQIIELNTSALRRGHSFIHPHQFYLEKLLLAGIDKFVIGSDAHTLLELGYEGQKALELLKKYNLKPVSLERGKWVIWEDF
ncbi:histidinol phosphate phosphatase [Carboxydothermus islandicus]|uniref:Histidinol-phosphatase n=1 Tax=Carboxydothermus islandicus TaxID=661089 RepID=A0A1L8D0Q0_9THEO|nr:histidinol-phosphatase [Carboxydothermus islandicus]GAV24707.1 histidinol phosphate phosphatase [Carboxydothermus islandicus]